MAKVVKVIEILSQSDKSWEDAAQGAEHQSRLKTSSLSISKTRVPKWLTIKSQSIESPLKSRL